jgi:hypothetical protein
MFAALHSDINSLDLASLNPASQPNSQKGGAPKVTDEII